MLQCPLKCLALFDVIAVRHCSRITFFLGVIGQGSGSDWTVVVSPSGRVPQNGVPNGRHFIENLDGMGCHGSPWVHIEGGGSHRRYRDFEIPDRDLVCLIRLNLGWDVGWEERL